ncbi:MAG: hypothetical protein IT576_00855, partial [Verrucomicrobiales bacterium]|nr:hypothetical protein [Verrucomicrobiales bacterium]
AWTVVRRAQFTEVTGPGGIQGSDHPETDPVWCVGWDARSLLLMVLDRGQWHTWRLPKASHSYDGAHGWNTEWPRIRDIGEKDLLMTMHGMFWRFPRGFSATQSAGISARSTYLKVVGDFCRWQDRVVLGCDDTAHNEFLNKRRAKGTVAAPQSQSNLWFLEPAQLDRLGPVIARGAVWLQDEVPAGVVSDPYLFAGVGRRALHLAQVGGKAQDVTLEIDEKGDGQWQPLQKVSLPAGGNVWTAFSDETPGAWIRLKMEASAQKVTAWFTGVGGAPPVLPAAPIFEGLAGPDTSDVTGGIVRARDHDQRTLHFAARRPEGPIGAYTLDAELKLTPSKDQGEAAWLEKNAAIPNRKGVLEVDEASVVYTNDKGRRFRLPRSGDARFDGDGPLGGERLCREVSTERDLFNCHGTFYELPAENAGGFARVRPVATHGWRIHDFCSYRGLLVLSGVRNGAEVENRHIIRSSDGKTALWVGAIDDIWQLGKPTGHGGPWLNTPVAAGQVSDPYLMTGYDQKKLTVSTDVASSVTLEVDLSGMGDWVVWKTFDLEGSGNPVEYHFPEAFQAYWVRFSSTVPARVSAQLDYR